MSRSLLSLSRAASAAISNESVKKSTRLRTLGSPFENRLQTHYSNNDQRFHAQSRSIMIWSQAKSSSPSYLQHMPSSSLVTTQKRMLHLHEHQSVSLLRAAGLTTQNGDVARTPAEARQVAEHLVQKSPGCDLIVKAQIHAGGRGKGHFDNGFKGKFSGITFMCRQ